VKRSIQLDIPVSRGLDNICLKNNVGVTNQSCCPNISPLYLEKPLYLGKKPTKNRKTNT
jgi:hypothetical protein